MRWRGVPLEVYADGPLLRSVDVDTSTIRHDTTNLFAALNVLDGTVAPRPPRSDTRAPGLPVIWTATAATILRKMRHRKEG